MTAPDRTPAPPLGETDLQRIETLVGAATQAPWHPFVSPWPDKMHAVTATDEAGPPIAYVGNTLLGGPANDANLQFIAAARTDVPALVAEVRRLRAALQSVHDTIAWHHENGVTPTIDPHSGVTEGIRAALGLPSGPVNLGYRTWEEERAELVRRGVLAAPDAGGRATEESTT